MSEQQKLAAAKEYIDIQIESMKAHGCAPKELSEDEYAEMVKQAADAIPS